MADWKFMEKIKEHMEWLGFRVEDRVTGIKGVVVSVSFDLFGCIQALVDPGLGSDDKALDRHWLDVCRLKKSSNKRVMALPDFLEGSTAEGKKGPADKPTGRF